MPDRPVRDSEFSLIAGAAVTKRMVVILSTAADNTVLPPAGALGQAFGVATADQATVGKEVTVLTEGVAQCIASAAITRGAFVSIANVSGQVQTQAKAGAGAQPQPIVGQALTSAGAAGDFIDILLTPGGMY